MRAYLNDLKISGVFVVLPETEYLFEDDMKFNALSEKRNRALAAVMGYERHRIFKPTSCISKVASWGLQQLLDKKILQKDEIAALILACFGPDFLVPGTTNIIAKNCGLPNSILSLDMHGVCTGFVNGVFQGFNILRSLDGNGKIVLINGECFGAIPDRSNTSGYPLWGEAISITILEKSDTKNQIYYDVKTDASDWEALVWPNRGFRKLSQEDLDFFAGPKYGNVSYVDGVLMDGTAVFNYVVQDVPVYLNEFLNYTQTDKKDIDYFFFHQPNNFMLEKLAQHFEIAPEQMPKDVVKYYGNSNGATIPVCIAHNASRQMLDDKTYKCVFSGFGAGLSYAALLMDVGKMDFCEMVVSEF